MSFYVSSVGIPILFAFVAGWVAHEAFQRWRFRCDMARLSAAYDPWAQ